MKRSEKIEIRMTLTEKENLAKLAQQQGESVSGLIRGLVDTYMTLNTPTTHRRLPKWQIAGLIALSALIGHAITWLPGRSDRMAEGPVQAPVYYVHGVLDDNAFGLSVEPSDPNQTVALTDDLHVTLSLRLDTPVGPSLWVSFHDCPVADGCEAYREVEVGLSGSSPSVIGSATPSGTPLHLFVQAMA